MTSTTLTLSREGDRIQISILIHNTEVIHTGAQNVAPHLLSHQAIFLASETATTHETVLSFLNTMRAEGQTPNHLLHDFSWTCSPCRHHKYYDAYGLDIDHEIDDVIRFVASKIARKGTPHVFFDKVAEQLGEVLFYLDNKTIIPILGTFPATVKIVIGILQLVIGACVAALALLPALVSKNARIVLYRSAKHIGHGLTNTFLGTLQAVPLLGSCVAAMLHA